MSEIAQTNLQLYNQLVAFGWSDGDLASVRRAYDLATDIFAGQLRPSGKTFLAHLVGTASAVAVVRARPELVRAALLHAAYTHGDFGDRSTGVAEHKRREVRDSIGAEAESLVAAYARRGYSTAIVEDWLASARTLPAFERDLAILRIANEIDDRVDLGTRYADRGGDAMSTDGTFEQMTLLAGELGESTLVELARRVSSRSSGATVPTPLTSSTERSSRTAPRSHRLRFTVVARRAVYGVAGRLRHAVVRVRKLWPESPSTAGAPRSSTIVGETSNDEAIP